MLINGFGILFYIKKSYIGNVGEIFILTACISFKLKYYGFLVEIINSINTK